MILLIGGHQGSGKTVLRGVIDSHPQVTVLDDFGAFRRTGGSRTKYVRGLRLKWRYGPSRHPLTLQFSATFLAHLAWRTGIRKRVKFDDVAVVLHRIFPEALVVGDVSNRYVHVAAEEDRNPQLKVIMVHRDCRDIAAAIGQRFRDIWLPLLHDPKQQHFTSQIDTAGKVAKHWLTFAERAERLRGDVFTVRYEDLVSNPQAALAPLGEWLGVAPDLFHLELLHARDVGIYQRLLSEEEVTAVMKVAGPKMAQLGYLD